MTLYADGGKIPFPNRRDHPPHIPTGTSGYEVFTFYPTLEEFRDFKGCIQKIEAIGAHRRSGICKIVAPDGWTPRPSKGKFKYMDSQVEHFIIQSPVRESVECQNEAIVKSNHVYKKSMTASEYRKLAESSKYRNPCPDLRGKDMENQYFKTMFTSHPIYGADTEGSFYDEDVNEFNMKRLETILDETKAATGGKVIKGVNSVYLYFGMYGASFAWHVEDMELYSINYLHYGSPKYWFAIPPEAAPRFERLMRQQFPLQDRQCKAFMRHKSFMVLPSLLEKHKIPYGTMIQYPNEFIITFPHGYHMGFNLGYNIAESTNFATDRWIDFGKNAVLCKCRSDMVEIDMTPFMKKYRRDDFEKWYSYWYLPKPATELDALTKKKKRKREETSFIESFSKMGGKRQRTSEGTEIIVGPLIDVNLGDIVIAWMDGGSRVRQGRVERLVLRTLLTIDFEDGSVSENTLPSDIVQCGCIQQQGCRDGRHQSGSRVKVRWNDGDLYDGYYRCISKNIDYTVAFANGSTAQLPRADLYGADDIVPPEVRRRLRRTVYKC
ncbi:JmjC domain protein [Trichostrongylus colubriformis]|uniref:JmjC domain protein n=1 Tax=Trichostrongylus colubriformis TaxID=6319 RepID=A0AAN8F4B6_TRICO